MSDTLNTKQGSPFTSNSLVATIGFSLFTVWVLFACFWLLGFPDGPQGFRDSALVRVGAFAGFPVGFLAASLLGKKPSFNIFDKNVLLVVAAMAALLPSACAAIDSVVPIPLVVPILCFMAACAAGAVIQVCWLDVLSRYDLSKLGLSIGTSTAAGVVVFLLLASMPWYAQDIAACVCILTSVGLVAHSSQVAPYNSERAPLERTQEKWEFTREIEPSLLLFGMVFALSFFFLMGRSPEVLLMGICGLALGGLAIIAADMSKHVFRITTVQRIIMVITVASCVLMWIPNAQFRVVMSLIVSAACSFLVIANSVFLIRKICTPRNVPVFRAISKRLLIFAVGFALGWLVATVILAIPHVDPDVLKYVRLGLAIALVAVMMLFLPVEKHHDDTASAAGGHRAYVEEQPKVARVGDQARPAAALDSVNAPVSATAADNAASLTPPPVAPAGVSLSESDIFDAKCASIAKLYQLSPREAEILPYLAKGRNNAYLQEKFVISPHTAKSHIYNIYRKLDIHSQQKLMDFVEEFPEDYDI